MYPQHSVKRKHDRYTKKTFKIFGGNLYEGFLGGLKPTKLQNHLNTLQAHWNWTNKTKSAKRIQLYFGGKAGFSLVG